MPVCIYLAIAMSVHACILAGRAGISIVLQVHWLARLFYTYVLVELVFTIVWSPLEWANFALGQFN
jgi:hypothetical protein